jgi:hypothetical protein
MTRPDWPTLRLALVLSAGALSTGALSAGAGAAETASPPPAAPVTAQAPATPAAFIDPQASAALNRMARTLAEARGFNVTIRAAYDSMQADGRMIEFSERRAVALARPDRVRVDTEESDGRKSSASFDGAALTVFDQQENVYGQAAVNGNVDDALRYLLQTLNVRMPLAMLLSSTLPADLQKRLIGLDYVERDMPAATPTDHLSGRMAEVDFQVWLPTEGPALPSRLIISYRTEAGRPQYRADFTDWALNPDPSAAPVPVAPPASSERIPFIVRSSAPESIARSGAQENVTRSGAQGAPQ